MSDSGGGGAGGTPAVSVVTPVRDCLTYLPVAIASVEAQALSQIELLVVDHGSTDGSGAWLEAIGQSVPWLTVLRMDDEGPSAARNLGISLARAPLIAFLDADDAWLPAKLGPQLAAHAADPELIFSFTDYLHFGLGGRGQGTCFEYWPAFQRVLRSAPAESSVYRRLEGASGHLLAENIVGTSTVVARRDALQNAGGFETSLRSASDWDLWLRLARTGPVAFTADLGTRHLLPPTGVASGEARVRAACMSQILAAHAPRVMADTGGPEAVRRAQANLLAVEAELARLEGRRWTAVAANLRALLRTPSRQLGWIMLGDLLKAARRGKVRPLDRL